MTNVRAGRPATASLDVVLPALLALGLGTLIALGNPPLSQRTANHGAGMDAMWTDMSPFWQHCHRHR